MCQSGLVISETVILTDTGKMFRQSGLSLFMAPSVALLKIAPANNSLFSSESVTFVKDLSDC